MAVSIIGQAETALQTGNDEAGSSLQKPVKQTYKPLLSPATTKPITRIAPKTVTSNMRPRTIGHRQITRVGAGRSIDILLKKLASHKVKSLYP